MVTTHNSIALKLSGITEDILFSSCWSKKFCLWTTHIKLSVRRYINIELTSLHFAQSYSGAVSKTLQSWYRALKTFYQTSLLPLCNVFCHVHEKSLKLLRIGNILFVSKHQPNQATNSFVSIFEWTYIGHIYKQVCCC